MISISSVAILALFTVALFSGTIMANAMGDENYHGEDDEQPGIGVDYGPGDQNDEMPEESRTRNKDASVVTVLSVAPSALIMLPT